MRATTLKEKQRQVREDAILEAAHALLVSEGYDAMTMDDLAAKVGISKPTLYQHFKSKEQIAAQTIVRYIESVVGRIEQLSPLERAIDHLELVLRTMLEARFGAGSPRVQQRIVMLEHDPRMLQLQTKMQSTFTLLIETAKVQGDINPELPTVLIVMMIVSMFRNPDYQAWLEAGLFDRDNLCESLVQMFFRGVRVPIAW